MDRVNNTNIVAILDYVLVRSAGQGIWTRMQVLIQLILDVVVNSLLNISIISNTTKMNFIEPDFKPQITAGAIICIILFLLLLVVSLK
jgi:hypothetical protein